MNLVYMQSTVEIDTMDESLLLGIYAMYTLYGILLLAAVHNTIRYVVAEQRYRNFHIAYFYVLVYLIVWLRVLWLTMILIVVRSYSPDKEQAMDRD